jgi:hypothetical protein
MGAVFGVTGADEPYFNELKEQGSSNYEVRQYNSFFFAEINESDDGQAFTALAKYIGAVGGQPENKQCMRMNFATFPLLS